MIFTDQEVLRTRIKDMAGRLVRGPILISSDTSNFMGIQPGTVLRLENNDYYVWGHAVEGRFGIDEQPKFWVKRVADLSSGDKKILKLDFYEDFTARIGPFLVRAYRDPLKESRILDLVQGHPHFMQGRTILDRKGNQVRLIDLVRGLSLYHYLLQLEADHETYFYQTLPGILAKLLEAFEAMAFLNGLGQQHGDIRTDHIIVCADTGRFVWIDFDYRVGHSDYDVWSLGNVLAFAVGKGSPTYHEIAGNPGAYPGLRQGRNLTEDDFLMVFNHRIANLGKLYPYIPEKLNRVLMNFSVGTNYFYDDINTLICDFKEALL